MKLTAKLITLTVLTALASAANAATTVATTAKKATTTSTTAAPAASTTTAPATITAAATTATSTTAAPKKEEAPSVKFNLSYDLGYSLQAETQTDKEGAQSRSQSVSHEFTPGMAYGQYSSFAYIAYEQDLIASSKNSWSDPIFGLSKKAWELGKYLKLAPSGSVTLPLTDSTRNEVGLLYGVGAGLNLGLNTKNLGMDAWSMSYQLNASRSFTSFDTNAKTNSPNRLYGFRNRFNLGYSFTDAFSFFTRFDFNSNYSVNGIVTNSFSHFQSFSYSINEVTSVSFTHANGGPYLKTETYENNLKFYDTENSSYSVGLSVNL